MDATPSSPARERFDALPGHVKERYLDRHRDINVDHLWWSDVYAQFTADMKDVGIAVDRMFFSGFCSQGDGACFEGSVCKWARFLPTLGINDPVLVDHAAFHFKFSSTHFGHYYHENCVSFGADLPLPSNPADEDEDDYFVNTYGPVPQDDVRDAVFMECLRRYNADSLEERFGEAFKDHMRDLYRRLEEEHDFRTSDEQVLEALEANDMLDELIDEHEAESEV